MWIFRIESGELVVTNEDTGMVTWKGKPDGYPVTTLIPINDDCIILLDPWVGPNRFSNLVRCRSDGSIAWRADLPNTTGSDVYTSVKIKDTSLVGFAWSGFTVIIDASTGQIISTEFVK